MTKVASLFFSHKVIIFVPSSTSHLKNDKIEILAQKDNNIFYILIKLLFDYDLYFFHENYPLVKITVRNFRYYQLSLIKVGFIFCSSLNKWNVKIKVIVNRAP